tara:strand:+ start:498 stop:2378 length:1881 start_codon:yes stop_codon:yes gene_type:complete
LPLQQLKFKPGIDKESTVYSNEGGWYEMDKVRFRAGYPEKIGGWERVTEATFQGTCRSLFNWVVLDGDTLTSVGTSLKYYLKKGGAYNDVTPIRATTAAGDVTFAATNGSATITITDTSHGAIVNDFVTFSGAVSLGGNITAGVLNQEYQVKTVPNANSYTITATATANSSDTGNGGSSTVGTYQINTGPSVVVPVVGWGASTWSDGAWGIGGYVATALDSIRVWSQSNFGEDLVFGPRGGALYYWDATNGTNTRGVLVSSLGGASNVPTVQNYILISDTSRFVFCFGANTLGTSTQDPLLIRWSDQEDVTNWTPSDTNQAGDIRLSEGSEIITARQSRQEILVWTDTALYSMQYVGFGSGIWSTQLLGANISIASQNATAYSSGISFWMGLDKFYMYDGRVQPLPCTVRRHVFNDFNAEQYQQVHAGTNEQFNEIWWFYCSASSEQIDRYVVYNYVQNIWYYGTMGRTAWLDSDLIATPIAATYTNNLVYHESGVDDNETGTPAAISAYITSTQFDIENGDRFAFVWRVLPDVTFNGSTVTAPAATMTLLPLASSGSGYNSPTSEGGVNAAAVTRSATAPVEAFTGQINTRVRGRQMSFKIESDALGVQWQLGVPRIDIRPDGRR